jgi:hypothetical protein
MQILYFSLGLEQLLLKIKWTDRITEDNFFQREKDEKLLSKSYKIEATHL